jgi:hypothetical protein
MLERAEHVARDRDLQKVVHAACHRVRARPALGEC